MREISYQRAADVQAAVDLAQVDPSSSFLGGGTNLVDLMREGVQSPSSLIDVSRLSKEIRTLSDGRTIIGAAAKNTAVASHPAIVANYPLLSRAILSGATGQIRNMATVGGNLLQRTRCMYFYDDASDCNKRRPGSGCDAIDGFNRMHAILGASSACVATHPSDMCVALAALDATVHVYSASGSRAIKMGDFHLLPGDTPHIETSLRTGEIITEIELPAAFAGARSSYRKVRDRSSYAFALVAVAAEMIVRSNIIEHIRIALGGVAHRPWRASVAEGMLLGKDLSLASLTSAAEAELIAATTLRDNAFKVRLARNTIVASLSELGGIQ